MERLWRATIETMNTATSLPRTASTLVGLIHSSSRTAVAMNRDPLTGVAEERLTSSRLELAWRGGELCIRCTATAVVGIRTGRQPRASRAM